VILSYLRRAPVFASAVFLVAVETVLQRASALCVACHRVIPSSRRFPLCTRCLAAHHQRLRAADSVRPVEGTFINPRRWGAW
jgi:predicted amidophosphoribosyltransferase